MRRIIIEAVAQHEMRSPYADDGLGDWFINDDGDIVIRAVGDNPLDDETFLVALHELVEFALCAKRGISQEIVDAFDMGYKGDGEPGDDPDSPYRAEHRKAMLIEMLMANFLGLIEYGTIE